MHLNARIKLCDLLFGPLCMQSIVEPSARTKKAEMEVKKVRRMYTLAQSNEATTQRSERLTFIYLFTILYSSCTINTNTCPGTQCVGYSRDVKSARPEYTLSSRPKFWPRPRSRSQSFGLDLGLGLKYLASTWLRSAAEEAAARKRRTSLFADYRTSATHR